MIRYSVNFDPMGHDYCMPTFFLHVKIIWCKTMRAEVMLDYNAVRIVNRKGCWYVPSVDFLDYLLKFHDIDNLDYVEALHLLKITKEKQNA